MSNTPETISVRCIPDSDLRNFIGNECRRPEVPQYSEGDMYLNSALSIASDCTEHVFAENTQNTIASVREDVHNNLTNQDDTVIITEDVLLKYLTRTLADDELCAYITAESEREGSQIHAWFEDWNSDIFGTGWKSETEASDEVS